MSPDDDDFDVFKTTPEFEDYSAIEDILIEAFDHAIQNGTLYSGLDNGLSALDMATAAQNALRNAGYTIKLETPTS